MLAENRTGMSFWLLQSEYFFLFFSFSISFFVRRAYMFIQYIYIHTEYIRVYKWLTRETNA